MNEHDMVVLTHPITEHGLGEGDAGVIVHCYPGVAAFEVEFMTADGDTIAVLTLEEKDIRPEWTLHVRETG